MILFKVIAKARKFGAIGIFYNIVDFIEGESEKNAIDNLYNNNEWDFYFPPKVTPFYILGAI